MEKKRAISTNVVVLGVVSLLNDVASEMVYPVVPIFLISVLGAPALVVGFIEGLADSISKILMAFSGVFSDRSQKRRPYVVWGYSFATFSHLIMSLAGTWPMVMFARLINRTGKGVRTSARDALITESSDKLSRGRNFGFHRTLDSLGAVVGPLLSIVVLKWLGGNYRMLFLAAFFPALLGVLMFVFFVKEKAQYQSRLGNEIFYHSGAPSPKVKKIPVTSSAKIYLHFADNFSLIWKNKKLSLFFIASIIFSLGNSSDAFLILRAKNLGLTTLLAVLTYVVYNISQTLLSTPMGRLADKIGAKKVFEGGLLVFTLVYFFFGFIKDPIFIWLLFPIYGVYIAATDGVSKAYVAEFITERESGSYFGLYQSAISISAFFASWMAGILWYKISPAATFYFGSIMAVSAFLILNYGKLLKKFNIKL